MKVNTRTGPNFRHKSGSYPWSGCPLDSRSPQTHRSQPHHRPATTTDQPPPPAAPPTGSTAHRHQPRLSPAAGRRHRLRPPPPSTASGKHRPPSPPATSPWRPLTMATDADHPPPVAPTATAKHPPRPTTHTVAGLGCLRPRLTAHCRRPRRDRPRHRGARRRRPRLPATTAPSHCPQPPSPGRRHLAAVRPPSPGCRTRGRRTCGRRLGPPAPPYRGPRRTWRRRVRWAGSDPRVEASSCWRRCASCLPYPASCEERTHR